MWAWATNYAVARAVSLVRFVLLALHTVQKTCDKMFTELLPSIIDEGFCAKAFACFGARATQKKLSGEGNISVGRNRKCERTIKQHVVDSDQLGVVRITGGFNGASVWLDSRLTNSQRKAVVYVLRFTNPLSRYRTHWAPPNKEDRAPTMNNVYCYSGSRKLFPGRPAQKTLLLGRMGHTDVFSDLWGQRKGVSGE